MQATLGRGRVRLVLLLTAAIVAAGAMAATSFGLSQHLCGISGSVVGPQESCPGISARHSWKRVTGYRNSSSGIDMCVVIRNSNDNYLFSRCSFWATSIYIPPGDMCNGCRLTRAYNKNNNVTQGRERRYLYADTN